MIAMLFMMMRRENVIWVGYEEVVLKYDNVTAGR